MPEGAGDPETRAEIYRLLSTLTSYPSGQLVAELEDGSLNGSLAGLLSRLGRAIEGEPIEVGSTRDLGSEYLRLFELPNGERPCSLYGGLYEADRHAVMEELARFYRHFGLSIEHAEARDLPDSVPTVLEFLSFLCELEARASRADEVASARRAQRDLLARHVTGWTRAILTAVDGLNPAPIYRSTLELLDDHCRSELETLGSE